MRFKCQAGPLRAGIERIANIARNRYWELHTGIMELILDSEGMSAGAAKVNSRFREKLRIEIAVEEPGSVRISAEDLLNVLSGFSQAECLTMHTHEQHLHIINANKNRKCAVPVLKVIEPTVIASPLTNVLAAAGKAMRASRIRDCLLRIARNQLVATGGDDAHRWDIEYQGIGVAEVDGPIEIVLPKTMARDLVVALGAASVNERLSCQFDPPRLTVSGTNFSANVLEPSTELRAGFVEAGNQCGVRCTMAVEDIIRELRGFCGAAGGAVTDGAAAEMLVDPIARSLIFSFRGSVAGIRSSWLPVHWLNSNNGNQAPVRYRVPAQALLALRRHLPPDGHIQMDFVDGVKPALVVNLQAESYVQDTAWIRDPLRKTRHRFLFTTCLKVSAEHHPDAPDEKATVQQPTQEASTQL